MWDWTKTNVAELIMTTKEQSKQTQDLRLLTEASTSKLEALISKRVVPE